MSSRSFPSLCADRRCAQDDMKGIIRNSRSPLFSGRETATPRFARLAVTMCRRARVTAAPRYIILERHLPTHVILKKCSD